MIELVEAAAILGFLVLFVLGSISLGNPTWLGFSSRKYSSLVYFGGAIGCLVIESMIVVQEVPESTATQHSYADPTARPLHDLEELMETFSVKTNAQQSQWREQNEWQYWVKGDCLISDVSETSWASEIADAAYEITCELSTGDRAILFYEAEFKTKVLDWNKGDTIAFYGNLKTLRHWGFWTSGYILVN